MLVLLNREESELEQAEYLKIEEGMGSRPVEARKDCWESSFPGGRR